MEEPPIQVEDSHSRPPSQEDLVAMIQEYLEAEGDKNAPAHAVIVADIVQEHIEARIAAEISRLKNARIGGRVIRFIGNKLSPVAEWYMTRLFDGTFWVMVSRRTRSTT